MVLQHSVSVIHRYIAKECLKYLILVQTVILSIFIVVEYLESMDRFQKMGLSMARGLFYVLLKMPYMINLLLPVCMMLSSVIVVSLMNRNNEIIVLKTSGMPVFFLLQPLLFISFIAACLIFIASETIVPISMTRVNYIKHTQLQKRDVVAAKGKNIWIKGKHQITHIAYYDQQTGMIFGISLNCFNDEFQLIKRVDAKAGVYINGTWRLFDALEYLPLKGQKGNIAQNQSQYYSIKDEVLDFSKEDLLSVVKTSEEMRFKELLAHIQKIESDGYEAVNYKVDLFAKTSFPLAAIILCLLGTSFAIRSKHKYHMALSIAYGILIAFSYWVCHSFCLSLGYGTVLNPFWASWSTNFLFLGISLIQFFNATE
ncbi:MAG: LPS export ABC transporter permease LptG [Desulfobacterales bacterium]|nr:LPS export ABC transporter permease LptG [Desulfobacterales bacterium]